MDITAQIPLRVVAHLVGVSLDFQAEFKGLADSILATHAPAGDVDPKLALAGLEIVRDIIQTKRDNPSDDFISNLVQVADDGDTLSIDEVMAFVASLLTAGPDTTAHYLNFAIYTILQNADFIPKIQGDDSMIDIAITEALRLNYFGHSGGVRFAK